MQGLSLATKGMLVPFASNVTTGSGPIVRREDEFIKPIITCNKVEIKTESVESEDVKIKIGKVSLSEKVNIEIENVSLRDDSIED